MDQLKDILTFEKIEGVNCWTFDTTRSNLIEVVRNEELQSEIEDWQTFRHFSDKYNRILHNPEEYVYIFIICTLLKDNKILYHPIEQDERSYFYKTGMHFNLVRWFYREVITHDKEYNYTIETRGLHGQVFSSDNDNRSFFKVLYDLIMDKTPKSRIYEISNSEQAQQAVSGGSDVYRGSNYFAVKDEHQRLRLINILSDNKKPTFDQLLSACIFFIMEFKGEDLGLASHFKIYSTHDIGGVIDLILRKFGSFQTRLKEIALNSESLQEYEISVNGLLEEIAS